MSPKGKLVKTHEAANEGGVSLQHYLPFSFVFPITLFAREELIVNPNAVFVSVLTF